MKKTITVLFLCFCLLFGLCGCLQSEVQPMENDDPVPTGIEDITRSMAYFKANL